MNIFRLKASVISFRGSKPAEFLNGLTSNAVTAPQNAFLDIHGRIVAAFDQAKISENELWIVVHKDYVQRLTEHLDRYLKLGGVTMEVTDQCVYFDCDGTFAFDKNDVHIPQKAGRLILSRKEFPSMELEERFLLFRLQHNIPLHGVDFTDEMILNTGYDRVSLTKGCYLGQEFVSKVHSRSKPTWKLVVKFEDECSEDERIKMTSKTVDPSSGRMRGFVFVKNQ